MIVLMDLVGRVARSLQRVSEENEVHIWHFDQAGRVRRFRHRSDSHQHWRACSEAALASER